MAVFPESMDKVDVNDPPAAISKIENYIGYMCERTEFAMRNVTKNVTEAGVSSAELYLLVQELASKVAGIESNVTNLQTDVSGLQRDIGSTTTPGTIKYELADHEQRIEALENA